MYCFRVEKSLLKGQILCPSMLYQWFFLVRLHELVADLCGPVTQSLL